MNELVSRYFNSLKGKTVAVLGIGVSNRPLIKLLLSYGVKTIACDRTERELMDAEVLDLEKSGAELRAGKTYLDNLSADVVFRTPGMHPNIPELETLRKKGAVITSEMEAFFEVCPCKIIGVTGSDGKTTTTTLIANILEHAGKKVWIGGNIGQPLLPVADRMNNEDVVVVELSSFQLMNMTRSPHVAVVTNLAPNHLDVHKDMDEYIEAKENIYLHQCESDHLVVNLDNEITESFLPKAKGYTIGFSRKKMLCNGAYLKDGMIYFMNEQIMPASDILIPGLHNVENYLAALCAIQGFANTEDVVKVAREFAGVEHRIEFVRTVNGVRYYNDSIASSPTRTIAGLHAFDQKLILIAGGYDKQIPFDVLGPEIVDHVSTLILCGATANKIKEAVVSAPGYRENCPDIITVHDLKSAVMAAKQCAKRGDIVTLSPACAAFDQFKNFMVRGNTYKEIVNALQDGV